MFKKLTVSSLMLLAGVFANASVFANATAQCGKLCPLEGVRGTVCLKEQIPVVPGLVGTGLFPLDFEVRDGKGVLLPVANVPIFITDVTATYVAAGIIPAGTWVVRQAFVPLNLAWIKPFCSVPTVQYTAQNATNGTLVTPLAAIILNGFFVNQGDATQVGATSSNIVTFAAVNDTVANVVQTNLVNNFCLHAYAFAEKNK